MDDEQLQPVPHVVFIRLNTWERKKLEKAFPMRPGKNSSSYFGWATQFKNALFEKIAAQGRIGREE
jgi:hypothetical protein